MNLKTFLALCSHNCRQVQLNLKTCLAFCRTADAIFGFQLFSRIIFIRFLEMEDASAEIKEGLAIINPHTNSGASASAATSVKTA